MTESSKSLTRKKEIISYVCIGGFLTSIIFLSPYYFEYLSQPILEEGIEEQKTCLGLFNMIASGGGMVYPFTTTEGKSKLEGIVKVKFDELCSPLKDLQRYYDEERKDYDYTKIDCDNLSWLILNSKGDAREKVENEYFGRRC